MHRFVNLDLSFLGWPHTVACVAAMAAFFPVMFARKGSAAHQSWGHVYALTYAVACVSSLGIYQLHKFWFPHWLAIGGLASPIVGLIQGVIGQLFITLIVLRRPDARPLTAFQETLH